MRSLLRNLLGSLWFIIPYNVLAHFANGFAYVAVTASFIAVCFLRPHVPDSWYPWRRSRGLPESPTSPVVGWRAWRVHEQTHVHSGATTYGLVSWAETSFVWEKGGKPSQAVCGPTGFPMRSGVTCPRCRIPYPEDGSPDSLPPCPRCSGQMVRFRVLPHRSPEPGHTCGLWAYKGPHRAWRRATGCVLGVCLGWGRLQEHTDGWRAEYAMPVALVDSWWLRSRTLTSERIWAVAREYAVPVVSMREARRLARMWAEEGTSSG